MVEVVGSNPAQSIKIINIIDQDYSMKGHGSYGAMANVGAILLGILLFLHGWGGNSLDPNLVIALGIVVCVIGIIGLVT